MRVGALRKTDADRARASAKAKASGTKRTYNTREFNAYKTRDRFETQPKLCECAEKAWNDGDGNCWRCGKSLP